jgi:ABC-type transport system involved in multi-copper enzyme maturation permease subunit
MTFLPILARELRVASRRRITYWIRTGAALAVMIIGTWLFLMMQNEPPQMVAQVLFGVLTSCATLSAYLSGIRDTADCLSGEKREGTLGLLFLTDLRGYDVVIGKMGANSINAFYGILAVLPIFGVPLLMGGITLGEFGRMALVAVNALFFSLSLGICVSALSRSGRKSAAMTFLMLLLFCGLLPAVGGYKMYLTSSNVNDPVFFWPSVGFTYFVAWDTPFKTYSDDFWCSLATVHGLGWLFLVVASIVAPRSWKDRPPGVKKLRWRERWLMWSHGDSTERLAFRRRLLNQNAFFWLAARSRLKPACVWAVLGLLACVWAWGVGKYHQEFLNPGAYLLTGLVLNLMLKAWVAAEAGRQLAEDRKLGALELLLSTPMTIHDIFRGQLLALRRQFLTPLLLVLVTIFVFMWATLREPDTEDMRSFVRLLCIGGMVLIVADLVALYWVGMWQALSAKNPNRTASASVARILILPPLSWAMVVLIAVLSSVRGGQNYESWPHMLLGLWFGLGIIADIGFSVAARRRLLTEFRLAAAQRYTPRAGFLKRLFTGKEH